MNNGIGEDYLENMVSRTAEPLREQNGALSDTNANPPVVSIIIPVENQRACRRCLESIIENTPPVFQLVLIGEASRLEDLRPQGSTEFVVLDDGAGTGFAGAVNAGITRAQGEYICVLHDDTLVLPGWIEPLLQEASRGEVAAAGPLQVDLEGRIWHCGTVFFPDLHVLRRIPYRVLAGALPAFPASCHAMEFPTMSMGCSVSRREVFEEVGLLDEPRFSENSSFGYADIDWMLRARMKGYTHVFTPRSRVIHPAAYDSHEAPCTIETAGKALVEGSVSGLLEKHADAPPLLFELEDNDLGFDTSQVAIARFYTDPEVSGTYPAKSFSRADTRELLRGKSREYESERRRFAEIRNETATSLEPRPLISVIIPTYQNARILTERTLPSVLSQTYENIEVLVVGDCCTDDTAERIAGLGDPRLRFVNLEERGCYPADKYYRWLVAGADPANRGIELLRGEWFAQIDDDDEFHADHIEVLLGHALQGALDLAYGKILLELDDDDWTEIGSFPPRCGDISHMCALYHSRLRMFRYDSDCWKLGEPGDWNRWRRMKEAGVRMGFVDRVVGIHYRLRSRFDE